jgi:hypothetical protein
MEGNNSSREKKKRFRNNKKKAKRMIEVKAKTGREIFCEH